MNVLFISTLFIVALLYFVLVLIFSSSWKREEYRAYIAFFLSMILWIITNVVFQIASSYDTVYFMAQLSYVSAIFLACSIWYFSFVLFDFYKSINTFLKLHFRKLLLCVLVLGFVFLFIPRFVLVDVSLEEGNRSIQTGFGLQVYALYLITVFSLSLVNLFQNRLVSQGFKKTQVTYVIIGFSLSLVFGILCNLILPILGIYYFVLIGPIFSILLAILLYYVIFRYSFLNMRVLLTNTVIIFCISFVALLGLAGLFFFIEQQFSLGSWVYVLVFVGMVYVWIMIQFGLRWLVNKFFPPQDINLTDVLSKIQPPSSFRERSFRIIPKHLEKAFAKFHASYCILVIRDRKGDIFQHFVYPKKTMFFSREKYEYITRFLDTHDAPFIFTHDLVDLGKEDVYKFFTKWHIGCVMQFERIDLYSGFLMIGDSSYGVEWSHDSMDLEHFRNEFTASVDPVLLHDFAMRLLKKQYISQ